MALNVSKLTMRRSGALLVGAFLCGAAGATLVETTSSSTARAENLSKNVPSEVQRNAPGFADIVDRVSPAVVSIQVKKSAQRQSMNFRGFEGSPFERFFEEFEERFGERPGNGGDRRRQFATGQGSGFFISEDGYVVTNGHVVDNADAVTVRLQNGDTFDARVIGVDEKTDLALVKVDDGSRSFPFVSFAEQQSRVGDWVVAVGNPFGLGGSVTAGIVSARGREIGAGPYDDFIQIDAPINRGNSGGPTFNLNGNVAGVNTAIFSPSGGSVGIGFAIPASIAKDVVSDLRDDGTVTRGWLGVRIQSITPEIAEATGLEEPEGALVTEPQSGSPADDAGIAAGDAIVAVNGNAVEDPRDLARTIAGRSPGESVDLTVYRNGNSREISVTLGNLENAEPVRTSRRSDERPESSEPTTMMGMRLAPAGAVGLDVDGLAVVELDPTGAAAESGLSVGDVILQAGGVDVASKGDLSSGIDNAKSEGRSNVLLKVRTGENTRFVALPVDSARG